MEDLIVASPEGFANFTIPAHHTADFFDADGSLQAHFDQPREYDKVDQSGHHTAKFGYGYKFPMTVKFVKHDPPAKVENMDGSF